MRRLVIISSGALLVALLGAASFMGEDVEKKNSPEFLPDLTCSEIKLDCDENKIKQDDKTSDIFLRKLRKRRRKAYA